MDTDPFVNWSMNNPDYTVSWSKIECWRPMYFVHMVFAYLVMLSGLGAMISRVHSSLKPLHVWCGRIYIISMLWCTATSLLIHNTGLPPAVLISFIWCLGGLTIGWGVIILHRHHLDTAASVALTKKIFDEKANLKETGSVYEVSDGKSPDILKLLNNEKAAVAAKKTLVQRVFSWKALHGAVMFMSWMNIAGRIFASNQSGDFTCYTQPYYKPGVSGPNIWTDTEIDAHLNMNNSIPVPVPITNPNFANLPWSMGLTNWGLLLSVVPLVFAFIFGLMWVGCGQACQKCKTEKLAQTVRQATP